MPTPTTAPHLDDDLAATLAKWGADQSALDESLAKQQDGLKEGRPDFHVWRDCWDAVLFFLDCEGLWRFVGNMERVQRLGFDRVQVEAEMRLRGMVAEMPGDDLRQLWQDLVVMERAALEVFNDKGE